MPTIQLHIGYTVPDYSAGPKQTVSSVQDHQRSLLFSSSVLSPAPGDHHHPRAYLYKIQVNNLEN